MIKKSKGWQTADIHDIPPIKESWGKSWHSIRHYFGISGFGVNAATKNKGESLTPEHDETKSGQQELFIVTEGKAEFCVAGKSFVGMPGCLVFVEPHIRRSAKAVDSPTSLLMIGGAPGQAYKIGAWEKV